MPRFSANLGFLWQGMPLLDQIEAAARAGFRAVEMHWPYDTDPKAVRAACERLGLTMLGVNTVKGDVAKGENGLGALAGRETEFQAAIDQAIAWQIEAGGKAIHAMAGIVRPADKPAATAVWVENLSIAADKAAAHGITLRDGRLDSRFDYRLDGRLDYRRDGRLDGRWLLLLARRRASRRLGSRGHAQFLGGGPLQQALAIAPLAAGLGALARRRSPRRLLPKDDRDPQDDNQ